MKADPKQIADKMRRIRSSQPQMTSAEMRAQINQHQRRLPNSSTPSSGKPLASIVGRETAAIS